jgi:cellulose synthase/poly-beta-1,6-N-acetylglucosamine synthase-like glycosyltransferase/putative flippase GtrA
VTPRLTTTARRWGRKVLRYSLVSLITIAVSQSVLVVAFGMLHWTARLANVVACAVATVPSYYLNRSWAWGRRGRSHLWKEVVPFWAIAFGGLALSTWAADLGATLARQAAASHAATTAIVMTSSLLAFGVLWVGKFAIFNAVLFTERPQPRHLRAPGRRERELATAGSRSLRVVVVAATAIGLLLVGSASMRAAEAQPEDPPGSTGPPTTEPATTAPPTTAPPTTAPPTTAPATTQPPATNPPTTAAPTTAPPATVPNTTVVAGGGAVATTAPGAGGTPPTVTSGGGGPPGSPASESGSGLPGTASGGAVGTSPPSSSQVEPPGPAGPFSFPKRVLRGLLDPDPAHLPQRVAELPGRAVEEATTVLRRLSPVELAVFLLLSLISIVLTTIAGTTLWWMLHAWRTPQTLAATGFSGAAGDPRRSFSLIVPARHEQAVLGATLSRLAAIDHPSFEILAVVGDDDPETSAVAQRAARRHPDRIRVVVDTSRPKNKPKALNAALPACRGDVVGVFDAEDEVHSQLLRHVDARFTETGADVVQGGVQLMNYHSNWYSVRNVLEYYFWFRSRLHFHAAQRFIPLGGNTVFVRADLLRAAGGWDPDCLAEDCELGVRLSSAGATVAVAYDPELVTREETPATLKAFLKQRTRWNQGFLQVLRKGEWRRLPTTRQRLLARYTLAMPFLQAFIGLLIPLSFATTILAKVPVLAALISFIPLVPVLAVLVMEGVALGEFCRNYGFRTRLRDHLRLVVGTLPYHALLSLAAVRAVLREQRGNRGWEKTAHVGAHRTEPAPAVGTGHWADLGDRTA